MVQEICSAEGKAVGIRMREHEMSAVYAAIWIRVSKGLFRIMTLDEERRRLERERRRLELDREEFIHYVEIEDRRLEQQQRLFDMKFKMLEEELVKLASEKKHVERQKAFYSHVSDYETRGTRIATKDNVVKGELFFSGVGSRQSLKKRYKDLIKIYHPDNLDGDKNTIQEINREYDQLSKVFIS